MSMFKLLSFVLILSSFQAFAEDSYEPSFEDTAEFLEAPAAKMITPGETWAYSFELVQADGTTRILTSKNKNVLLKPASTMKLFTGWWAFKNETRTDAYLSQMLKDSVNSMAEATLEKMGGIYAREDYYRGLGLEVNETTFNGVDGSGLSYENKATCGIEIELLKLMKADTTYSRFKKLLALPGKKGTLKTRLTALAGKVFAKTGTLNKTASLSGFLETKKGTVVFCVMSDYLATNLTSARKKIDAMVIKNYNLAK